MIRVMEIFLQIVTCSLLKGVNSSGMTLYLSVAGDGADGRPAAALSGPE